MHCPASAEIVDDQNEDLNVLWRRDAKVRRKPVSISSIPL